MWRLTRRNYCGGSVSGENQYQSPAAKEAMKKAAGSLAANAMTSGW